jgi:NAD(P)H-hydrate epimerase
LAERAKDVTVMVCADLGDLNENAKRELDRLKDPGVVPIFAPSDGAKAHRALGKADLVVDALLGTGARGAPEGAVFDAITAMNALGKLVVAVDIPSGVDCDTGSIPGEAVWANRTVTLGLPKPFLFKGEGMDRVGKWTVESIGFPTVILDEERDARLIGAQEVKALLPKRAKQTNKHKQGSVLIVAGCEKMPGAAVLAAGGALRAGAGLVTVASVASVCEAVSKNLPEAILLQLPEVRGVISPDAADVILEKQDRFQSAVFGPGISTAEPVGHFLKRVWSEPLKWRMVLDADALNWIAKGISLPTTDVVLTPHEGEIARLLHISPEDVSLSRFKAARQAFENLGKTIVLKGAYSLIAGAGNPLLVNPTGNPGLAAPGTGDVLSGVLGALLTRHESLRAAIAGVYWHGLAGDLCAKEIGPAGFLASEVADRLPKARATITSACA